MIRKLLSLLKPAGACGLLLALILIFGFAGSALALPPAPHQFYGQVTVGGAPAQQGIEVVAKIGGVQYEATTADAQGRYGYDIDDPFYVPADDPDTLDKEGGRDGETVEFYVAGVLAGSCAFKSGETTPLNLAIDALPDTTAPVVEAVDPDNGTTDVPVDQVVTVTFSEDVQQGDRFGQIALKDAAGNTVDCNVALSGKVLTIDPNDNLAYSTSYTVVIPAGAVADLAGNALAQDYAFSFTTEAEPDTIAPAVEAVDPVDGATNVPVGTSVTVTFSEDVKAGAAYDGIALKDAEGNAVAVTTNIEGKVLTIKPDANLAYSTKYTVIIPAGAVADLAGNALAQDYAFSFTTEAEPDTIAPTVEAAEPVDGATNVPVVVTITVTFSEDVQEGDSFGQIALKDAEGNPVDCNVTLNGNVLTIDPNANLAYSTAYTVTIPAGAVQDAAGNELADGYAFGFTTEAEPDNIAPAVEATEPADGATDVPVSTSVTVTFSEDVNAGAAYDGIELKDAEGNTVAVTRSIESKVLTIKPDVNLDYSTTYTVTIPAGAVQDAAGNGLAEEYTFSFTTQGASGEEQQPGEVTTPEEGTTEEGTAPEEEQQPSTGGVDEQPPGEVTDLTVSPQPGAGRFSISFTAPSDSDLRGVAVYATVYGSNDWEQVNFGDDEASLFECQPGESVDIWVQVPGNLVLGSDEVQFKVVAVDYSGNESQGVVADNAGQGYPVLAYWELTPGPEGWRTFSVPVQLAGGQKLLGDVIDLGKVDIAYKFDAASQQWVQVTADNNTIQPLEAVYVKLKEPVLAVIKPATEPTNPPVRNLLKGWNLVGFTKADNVYDALYSVRERWSVAVSPAVNPDPWAVTPRQNAAVKTHYGYWVYMDESGNLAGFSTTPVTVGTYPFERE
ncbi:Ig-like domain-containing protein [Desulfofundulus salinus]|uniref:SbsA Ig-like domain-containing protein n=1 Tax=Desulfofundulus salinus TaxID=2419843 RepID=A0A494X4C1_9FIRM|nr:Ig-like domain-containing protein [Desulfofundulus salinum]RKO67780.1 hypothetical protein D7024_13030 [Desulfofundulus salinum]